MDASRIGEEKIAEVVKLTTNTTPRGHTYWSTRTMAERTGASRGTVCRVWNELGLQPDRLDTFKVSNDPNFDREVPKGLQFHLILGNYSTHKYQNAQAWLSSTRDFTCTSRRPSQAASTRSNDGSAT